MEVHIHISLVYVHTCRYMYIYIHFALTYEPYYMSSHFQFIYVLSLYFKVCILVVKTDVKTYKYINFKFQLQTNSN